MSSPALPTTLNNMHRLKSCPLMTHSHSLVPQWPL